jgi:hypothetical protein
MFNQLSALGHLVKYEGLTGKTETSFNNRLIPIIIGHYVSSAKFQNGSAVFRKKVLKKSDIYMIYDFHVELSSAIGSERGT